MVSQNGGGSSVALGVTLHKTRRGLIRRNVRETYLRDDILCGIEGCSFCYKKQQSSSEENSIEDDKPFVPLLDPSLGSLFVIDHELAEKQLDFLSTPTVPMNNVIIASTILNHLSEKDLLSHGKLRALCRSSVEQQSSDDSSDSSKMRRHWFVFQNDFCRGASIIRDPCESQNSFLERSLWSVVKWYSSHIQRHLPCSGDVILVVSEEEAKNRALAQGVTAVTLMEFLNQTMKDPDQRLDLEKLVATAPTDSEPKKFLHEPHLTQPEITAQLRQNLIYQGTIKMDRRTWRCGTVMAGHQEIRIVGAECINRSIDGDIVAVKVIDQPKRDQDNKHNQQGQDNQLEQTDIEEVITEEGSSFADQFSATTTTSVIYGKVVGIIKRQRKEYAGSLVLEDDTTSGLSTPPNITGSIGSALFVKMNRLFRPVDRRIPDVVIRTQHTSQLIGKRIVVVIDRWDQNQRSPSGHWIDILGDIDDPKTEAEVILKQYDVSTRDFSDLVLRCLPPASYTIPDEEIAKRKDLRSSVVCSVDPPGCRDIDDALSCEKLPNGNFLAGVHIADVTHFVLPGTPLDLEASDRCTTVYLVDKRTDMLPTLLTTDLCSLVADKDRLTFSVLWELTPDAEIVNTEFCKSVIRSQKAFTYEEAQNVLDGKSPKSLLRPSLRRLCKLATQLRKRRMELGALELASLEVRFEMDTETHDPNDVAMYQIRLSNQMVEEFMLLANMSVAKQILNYLPSHSVLRRHPPPKEDALKALQAQLKSAGCQNFKFDTSKNLSHSLQSIERPGDPFFTKLIKFLTTRCMNQAVYICSGDVRLDNLIVSIDQTEETDLQNVNLAKYRHHGLAASLYTHFTSPIRRYADVLVHRLLAVSLGLIPLHSTMNDKMQIATQCDRMNFKHRNAQWASRASVEHYTYKYFRKNGEKFADGIVIGLTNTRMTVLVPHYGIEGRVRLPSEIRNEWDPLRIQLKLIGSETTTIRLFDHIWLHIRASVDNLRPETVMTFVHKTPRHKYASFEDAQSHKEKFEKEAGIN